MRFEVGEALTISGRRGRRLSLFGTFLTLCFVAFAAQAQESTRPPAAATAAAPANATCEKALEIPAVSWLKSMAGNEDVERSREKEIESNYAQENELERQQEETVRQSFLEGNWIFNRMLSELVSGKNPGQIARWLARYVQPSVKEAATILHTARHAHQFLTDGGQATDAQFKRLYEQYVNASEAYGKSVTHARMIVWTLESIRAGKGALYMTSLPRLDASDPVIAQAKNNIVYNLTSKDVKDRADQLLKDLDRDLFVKDGILAAQDVKATGDDGQPLPYPTLNLALNTVFQNNSVARVAKSRWDLLEQKATSSSRLWFAQLAAQIMTTVYSNPSAWQWWRNISLTLSGPLDVWAKSMLYNRKIYDLMTDTLMLDKDGNIVISTSDYLLDLQIDKLAKLSADANLDDDQWFEALVQNVGSRRVLDALLSALAKRAGIQQIPARPIHSPALSENAKTEDVKTGATTDQPQVLIGSEVTQNSARMLYNRLTAAADRVEKNNLKGIPWGKPPGWKIAMNMITRHLTVAGASAASVYTAVQIFDYLRIMLHF